MNLQNNIFLLFLLLFIANNGVLYGQKKGNTPNVQAELAIENNATLFSDWQGIPTALNPQISYLRYNPKQPWVWGVSFGVNYWELSGESLLSLKNKTFTVSTRKIFSIGIPILYTFHLKRGVFACGLSPIYAFRVDDILFTPNLWWHSALDPNRYHHDVGLGVPLSYSYYFAKKWGLRINVTPRLFYKIPYSAKYKETNYQYFTYTAPHTLSAGVGITYKIK